jgi:hypothetical protein
MVVAGDLTALLLFGNFSAFKRAVWGVTVE